MRKFLSLLLALCAMMALSVPAFAVEYSFDGPDSGLFGRSTSDETTYITAEPPTSRDRSKTAALIPPTFGSPTSYTINTGEPLKAHVTTQAMTGSTGWVAARYTAVTGDLYDSRGSLGTLRIPTLGLTVPIYEGTDSAALAKGAGHFTGTSIFDGNVAVAGHNRGVNNHFGQIHTLTAGDTITLDTALGSRTYAVSSVSMIGVEDIFVLDGTAENTITLITCVRDRPDYRWCVKAQETA